MSMTNNDKQTKKPSPNEEKKNERTKKSTDKDLIKETMKWKRHEKYCLFNPLSTSSSDISKLTF